MSGENSVTSEATAVLWTRLAETLQALEECGEGPMLVDFGARYEIAGRSGRASWSGHWSAWAASDLRRFRVFLRPEPGRSYDRIELQVACALCMTVIQTVDEGIDLASLLQGAEGHCQQPSGEGEQ